MTDWKAKVAEAAAALTTDYAAGEWCHDDWRRLRLVPAIMALLREVAKEQMRADGESMREYVLKNFLERFYPEDELTLVIGGEDER